MRGILLGLKGVLLPSIMVASFSVIDLMELSAAAKSITTSTLTSTTSIASADDNQSASLPVEVALRNMKDAAHRLRTSVLDIINDVEQRDMVVTGEPMIIQPIAYKDRNSIGWAREMLELGPAQQPRKKWLAMDVGNVGELVELLQADFNNAAIPDNLATQTKDNWSEMKTVMQDVQNHYQTLQQLTQGPKYDNIEIGKAALAIYDDMAKLEKPWKNVVHATRSK